MDVEEEIKWVPLILNFSPEQEALMEEHAKRSGLPLNCFCIHLIFQHSKEEQDPEQWQRQFSATLRRNDCAA